MASSIPTFTPTNKRRSFRPSAFRPLNPSNSLEALNDSLRASLMTVGMRVRKSVPEGYKTVSKPAFSIYEQTAAAYPELQPFSGLSKPSTSPSSSFDVSAADVMTDAQLEDAVDSVIAGLDRDVNGWDSLGGSQESNVSSASEVRVPTTRAVPARRNKRSLRYTQDDEEAFGLGFEIAAVPMERDAPLRAIAQPRSRRPAVRRVSSGKSERSVRFAALPGDEDFGEADFLMPDREL